MDLLYVKSPGYLWPYERFAGSYALMPNTFSAFKSLMNLLLKMFSFHNDYHELTYSARINSLSFLVSLACSKNDSSNGGHLVIGKVSSFS